MKLTTENIENLAWDKMQGLIPAIVQDARSGIVLMQGYMNQAAVKQTIESQLVTFFSRSKQRLWTKGETSNNTLELIDISTDCDTDSILILAKANGPTCHTGTQSCWSNAKLPAFSFIAELEDVIAERKSASPDSSYTASLFAKGIKRIAQKVGEEGVETALAAATNDKNQLVNEAADLLYHLTVLLQASDLSINEVVDVLKARHESS